MGGSWAAVGIPHSKADRLVLWAGGTAGMLQIS